MAIWHLGYFGSTRNRNPLGNTEISQYTCKGNRFYTATNIGVVGVHSISQSVVRKNILDDNNEDFYETGLHYRVEDVGSSCLYKSRSFANTHS